MSSSKGQTSVVLVHGAWADGSSWNDVIGPLLYKGLNVLAAPIPLISLSDDVVALDRILDRTLSKVIARYGRVDLLCIDELGHMELNKRGAELLFQVLTEREEKNSVAIASNESFSGWTKTFTDPRLCAAIVDRLTFNGQIIETAPPATVWNTDESP